jgi:hypothetical protein
MLDAFAKCMLYFFSAALTIGLLTMHRIGALHRFDSSRSNVHESGFIGDTPMQSRYIAMRQSVSPGREKPAHSD